METGQGYLEPCVAVCANAGRSFYMDYRLVLGADHVGESLAERLRYPLAFIGRQFSPRPPDEAVVQFRNAIAPLRRQAGLE